jgi:hypothetical protein
VEETATSITCSCDVLGTLGGGGGWGG